MSEHTSMINRNLIFNVPNMVFSSAKILSDKYIFLSFDSICK